MKRIAILLSLALVAAPAAAAPAPPSPDIEGVTLDEFVVQGRLPGPAWWKVSDGDTTVYVLGVPDALPRGLAWDQSVLKRRLTGATVLITPPEVRASAKATALPRLYAQYREVSRADVDLMTRLSPVQQARLGAAAAKVGKSPDAYRKLEPWFAGGQLAGDFRKRSALQFGAPVQAARKAAKKAKVRATPAMVVNTTATSLLGQLGALSPAEGLGCLDGAIGEIEAGPEALRRAGKAWSTGDVAGALTAPRSVERCLSVLPGAAEMKRDALARQATAIEDALTKPGHAVAVLSLRSLVAREGVLQRLKAKGYTVTSPQGAE